jgi:hypothetical protein
MTGHRCGTYVARARATRWSRPGSGGAGRLLTCEGSTRAGDGNRTRMTSLEGWSSTIELRPQQPPNHRLTPVAYRLPRLSSSTQPPRGVATQPEVA